MGLLEVVITAFALSVDAFVCSVISGKRRMEAASRLLTACAIAAAFGAFQFLMPVIGFFAGNSLQKYFADYDHWVAFTLLALVSLNMLKEAFFGDDDHQDAKEASETKDKNSSDSLSCGPCENIVKETSSSTADGDGSSKRLQIGVLTLLALAVGTSIDALAVGVSYGLVSNTIVLAATIIGVICAACSLTGFYLGQVLAYFKRLDPLLNTLGALVLLAIGVKILIEHEALAQLMALA